MSMASASNMDAEQLVVALPHLSVRYQGEMHGEMDNDHGDGKIDMESDLENEDGKSDMGSDLENEDGKAFGNYGGNCSICLDKIALNETAIIKGCEHAYCLICILRWAKHCLKPSCPQCKQPIEFLNVHRSLDGSIQDYMFEERLCRLLKAPWFEPSPIEGVAYGYTSDCFPYIYDSEEDDLDEVYFRRPPNQNQHQAARQVHRPNLQDSGAGPSREPKKKEAAKDKTGKLAKKMLRREATDKAAAAKHQRRLVKFGRKNSMTVT